MVKRQSYLHGTLVLAVGTVAVKLIGVLFKIPLTNILGGVGMSYFNVAYDLYYPLYALFVAGVPVAVSKLVSESMARGRARDARKLIRVSAALFLAVGLLGSLVMFFGAGWFSGLVNNPDARYAVMALSPALLCGCIMAALRGYWQGMQNMTPTAVSQIVEAFAKLVFGLIFSYGITVAGLRRFSLDGTVFGIVCGSAEDAQIMVLPFAAAGAILGVTLSMLCGAIYMVARHKLGRGAITDAQWLASPPAAPGRSLMRQLLAIAVPVCGAAVIANMTSFIDLISVMNRLNRAIETAPEMLLSMYRGSIPDGVGLDRLAAYLYGCYSGLAVPIYNLVPSLTTVIGVSLLPAVSAAWATKNTALLNRNVSSALRLTCMVAMPAGIGICVMANPIMELLFFSRPMEVAVIAPTLRIMGISAMIVAISLPVNAILQAVGRADLTLKLLVLGGIMKLVCNYILVAIPQLNIQAVPVGTLICYVFVLFASLNALVKLTKVEIPILSVFGKPFFAACCCGISAWSVNAALGGRLPVLVVVGVAVMVGVIIYVIICILTQTITKIDVLMLPNGEKFAKLLEKHFHLG